MAYFNNTIEPKRAQGKQKFYQKRGFKIFFTIAIILVIIGGAFAWKTGGVLNKISQGGMLSSLVKSLPGVDNSVKGEKDGRINIALLGMRGEGVEGGGTLADSIIVASIKPVENKVSMISVPRDLYVTVPGTQDKQKINAVHAYGEQKGRGKGLEDMKTILGEVTGLPIHYAVSINFAGFKQLINAIGGVEITLDAPFDEAVQFNEPHVCDSFFNVPTGKFQDKKAKVYWPGTTTVKRERIVKSYPLCTAPAETLECGGNFTLPAGKQTISGEKALCYARSRATSSDFERAKRQQLIIQLVKNKLVSVGTITNFEKLNGILNSLGDNVRTDMQPWEMKRLYELYGGMKDAQLYQRVLEASEEGFLYHPENGAAGYILLPIGENYSKIHDMAQNIFTIQPQSDIKPKN
jgi:LCP family protein required for cell wall assembly